LQVAVAALILAGGREPSYRIVREALLPLLLCADERFDASGTEPSFPCETAKAHRLLLEIG
jgi:hypothetical protein